MEGFQQAKVDSIDVYYPAELRSKAGIKSIRVKLRKLLFFSWLELEGAKAIAIYNEGDLL